jgi:trigger factor
LQNSRREKLSPEEAEVEYARSEKGLRFQLIEGRAMAQSDIKITFEDLKHLLQKISVSKWHNSDKQMDEEVQGIVIEFCLTKTKRLSDQVVAEKLLEVFKEKQTQQLKR